MGEGLDFYIKIAWETAKANRQFSLAEEGEVNFETHIRSNSVPRGHAERFGCFAKSAHNIICCAQDTVLAG